MKPWLFALTGSCLSAALIIVAFVATAPRDKDGSFDIRFEYSK